MSMQSGNPDLRTGTLRMLAGPTALVELMAFAFGQCDVTVGNGVLQWKNNPKSPGATVEGSRIRSVTRHGSAFVVHMKPGGNGVAALTFAASADDDAEAWVEAIERIKTTPAPTRPQPVRTSGPMAPGSAAPPDATPIQLTYTHGGKTCEKDYALLVIACDPIGLEGICHFTAEELEIFSKFSSYTFRTTLVKVKVQQQQKHAVIFAPQPLEGLTGGVCAFRNESAKQFGLDCANTMAENLVTVYQFARTKDEIKDLNIALKECEWWPFDLNIEVRDSVTTSPYFQHFDNSGLLSGLPWQLLGLQGQKHTLFVHASSCFESVLHCWSYANLLMSAPAVQAALPKHPDSPIVVLGAGVSGLLFAARLKELGYTNIDILEKTERFGGKTHTRVEAGPYPAGSLEKTVCELGTCYLSPAYSTPGAHDPSFVDYLEKKGVLTCNYQVDFSRGTKSFRGIFTGGQFSPDDRRVMDFGSYVVREAMALLGVDEETAKLAIAVALGWYTLIHHEYVGSDMPMPPLKPKDDTFLGQTFWDFLEESIIMIPLKGVLQYGYEVQGYGPIKEIPAFYGLIWITPAVTLWILLDSLLTEGVPGWKESPVVSAWTHGWGDIWTQLVEKVPLNITCSAVATSITRG